MIEEEITELKSQFQNELKQVHLMHLKLQISLLNALEERFGKEVFDVVEETSTDLIIDEFSKHVSGDNSLKGLIDSLWEPLKFKGYEFDVFNSESIVKIKCAKCPLADMYRSVGGEKWGYRLYCAADNALTKTFNPKIKFNREKTLMNGDKLCDHCYSE